MSLKRGATYDDLLEVPDDKIAEIVEGELYASPRPRIRHARVLSALGAKLFSAFDEGFKPPGGWWLLDEPELHLGDDVLVPDIAAWRRENLPALPDTPAIDLAPDWVCEILSPSTFDLDRRHKLPAYARHHVSWLWLIDPSEKSLEVLERATRGRDSSRTVEIISFTLSRSTESGSISPQSSPSDAEFSAFSTVCFAPLRSPTTWRTSQLSSALA